jgi:hypothetical protein
LQIVIYSSPDKSPVTIGPAFNTPAALPAHTIDHIAQQHPPAVRPDPRMKEAIN